MIATFRFVHRLTFLSVFMLLFTGLSAQVVINEYSASNRNGLTDFEGDTEDWIELYNTGASQADLTDFHLSDKGSNPMKFRMPAGILIPAGGYLVVHCDGQGGVFGGEVHASFKLTQTRPEDIVFADPTGTVIDAITMEPAQLDHSRGRTTDGANTWGFFTAPTPGAANTGGFANYATTPVFSVASGHYSAGQSVTITSPDPNVTLHYTIDGSDPTGASALVSGAIPVNSTTVVRAIAVSSDPTIMPSFVETNTYLINENHTMYVMSISGSGVPDLLTGNAGAEPIGSFELFSASGNLLDEGQGQYNKHGNDSWAYDQRGVDFIMRDQYGYNHAVQHQIFRGKSRDKFQRLILKAAANDNYPFEDGAHIRDSYVHSISQMGDMKIDARTHESAILYVNGQYWGVYDIREKVDDHDYTDYYYGQDEFNLQFLKTWGATWSEYGGAQAQTDWDNLRNYILTNDMSVPANWDYMDARYNWKSLIDYVCLNSFVVASDWLNWNTAWWHGLDTTATKKKWRYVLWDMDAIFGHYINYTGIPNTGSDADPCDAEGLPDPGGQGHIPILNKLMMDTDIVNQYYVARYIDLSNSTFNCTFMNAHLDSLINIIQPEMQRQINRWGGTMAQWQANVQQLRDSIDRRCIAIQQGMVDCYQLSGPHNITVTVEPPLSGWVQMNSLDITTFPWTGIYYGGVDMLLEAKEYPDWEFEYWTADSLTILPGADSANIVGDLTGASTITAHYRWVGEDPPPKLVLEDFVFEVPTAFSPNDDGINDILCPLGSDIAEVEFEVYSRWGERVFSSDNMSHVWDGKHNGTLVNSGVYVWKAKVLFTDGSQTSKTGDVTILR